MNTTAIATAQAAIKAALASLAAAYEAATDCRVEDTIVSLIDELNEYMGDLENHADQIEADRAPWFRSYAAA
jgi:hypothetical protein